VRLVVADTGPLNYLALIGQTGLLPALFEDVIIPPAVHTELANLKAPTTVREWIANAPSWLQIRSIPEVVAESIQADLLLIDDRAGVKAALNKGLRLTGTLGILDAAAERGLVDFGQAIRALEDTSFRRPPEILAALLEKHNSQSGTG
jgi:predicted nucleic acid-binding protein